MAPLQTRVSTNLPSLALSHTCVTYRTHCECSIITTRLTWTFVHVSNRPTEVLHQFCVNESNIVLGVFFLSLSYKSSPQNSFKINIVQPYLFNIVNVLYICFFDLTVCAFHKQGCSHHWGHWEHVLGKFRKTKNRRFSISPLELYFLKGGEGIFNQTFVFGKNTETL